MSVDISAQLIQADRPGGAGAPQRQPHHWQPASWSAIRPLTAVRARAGHRHHCSTAMTGPEAHIGYRFRAQGRRLALRSAPDRDPPASQRALVTPIPIATCRHRGQGARRIRQVGHSARLAGRRRHLRQVRYRSRRRDDGAGLSARALRRFGGLSILRSGRVASPIDAPSASPTFLLDSGSSRAIPAARCSSPGRSPPPRNRQQRTSVRRRHADPAGRAERRAAGDRHRHRRHLHPRRHRLLDNRRSMAPRPRRMRPPPTRTSPVTVTDAAANTAAAMSGRPSETDFRIQADLARLRNRR